MRRTYNAKYNDINDDVTSDVRSERNPFNDPYEDTDISRSYDKASMILRAVTGMLFLLWVGVIGYYIVFPLIPSWQDIGTKLKAYDPYDIGYAATTQFIVSITPPDYSIEEFSSGTDRKVTSVYSERRSIEHVDPSSVTLANLSYLDTVLIVESANIKGLIVDGYSQETMLEGFWHYPGSSVPGKRGNTVIFGHRFHKLPPSKETFFNLDLVKVGDKVRIEQTGIEFTYTVVKIAVADKYDESVLEKTGDHRITLITCTPLWTSEQRLVVTAIQDRLPSVI